MQAAAAPQEKTQAAPGEVEERSSGRGGLSDDVGQGLPRWFPAVPPRMRKRRCRWELVYGPGPLGWTMPLALTWALCQSLHGLLLALFLLRDQGLRRGFTISAAVSHCQSTTGSHTYYHLAQIGDAAAALFLLARRPRGLLFCCLGVVAGALALIRFPLPPLNGLPAPTWYLVVHETAALFAFVLSLLPPIINFGIGTWRAASAAAAAVALMSVLVFMPDLPSDGLGLGGAAVLKALSCAAEWLLFFSVLALNVRSLAFPGDEA